METLPFRLSGAMGDRLRVCDVGGNAARLADFSLPLRHRHPKPLRSSICDRGGGRVVECGGLENR
jgi:hypothetical protein